MFFAVTDNFPSRKQQRIGPMPDAELSLPTEPGNDLYDFSDTFFAFFFLLSSKFLQRLIGFRSDQCDVVFFLRIGPGDCPTLSSRCQCPSCTIKNPTRIWATPLCQRSRNSRYPVDEKQCGIPSTFINKDLRHLRRGQKLPDIEIWTDFTLPTSRKQWTTGSKSLTSWSTLEQRRILQPLYQSPGWRVSWR